MTRRRYRTFSAYFKLDTVMEGFRGEKSVAQICRERDIKDVLYYKWRDTFLGNAASVFGDQGNNNHQNSSWLRFLYKLWTPNLNPLKSVQKNNRSTSSILRLFHRLGTLRLRVIKQSVYR